MNAETERWLALSLVERVGPRTLTLLLERFGSSTALFASPVAEISRRCGLSPERAQAILDALGSPALIREKEHLARHGVRLIRRFELEYPPTLESIRLPPSLLYCKSSKPLPTGPALAVVGTRRNTRYGEKTVRRLIEEIAALRPDMVIVSGLARGIDTIAHAQALECGLPTLAVLAGGLAEVYPPENRELAERIVDGGALLTEFSMTRAPRGNNFAIRNRIISALSQGVLVAEAGEESGALITAGFAQSQGRPVVTIPGNLDTPSFAGCNRLIQTGQARLITRGEEILAELRKGPQAAIRQMDLQLSESRRRAAPSTESGIPSGALTLPPLEGDAGRIAAALARGPLHPNDLAADLALPMEKLAGLLLELELSGDIVQTPENFYALA